MKIWKPGDIAQVDRPSSDIHGMMVTVMSAEEESYARIGGTYDWVMVHDIDPGFPPPPEFVTWAMPAHNLKPIDKGNWDDIEKMTGWKAGKVKEDQDWEWVNES